MMIVRRGAPAEIRGILRRGCADVIVRQGQGSCLGLSSSVWRLFRLGLASGSSRDGMSCAAQILTQCASWPFDVVELLLELDRSCPTCHSARM